MAAMLAFASACGAAPSPGAGAMQTGLPTAGTAASLAPTAPASASPQVTATPGTANALIRCEDLPDQTYSSDTFRFSIGCPSNFTWQTYSAAPGRLFHARAVDDQHVSANPTGQVEISVVPNTGNSLRDWIAAHVGQQRSTDPNHLWDSTSSVTDIQIAGRPGVGFDYVLVGPGSPQSFHAAALVLPEGSVFLLDWWSDSSDYGPAIATVAQQMLASFAPFGA
jgi:hypothetical protein